MLELKISKRLCTVASYVRDGAVVADIGTDHAYLPIYLIQGGRAVRAVASDINEGPIMHAKENISKYSLEDKITARVSPGLNGIESYLPTDIVIAGMGGELIAKILDDSAYVRKSGVRLILQPMTCARELREYLQKGFLTIDENLVYEDNKVYQVICAEYDGKEHSLNNIELELGAHNIKKGGEEFGRLLNLTIAKKQKRLNGLKTGGYDTSEIEKEITELEAIK